MPRCRQCERHADHPRAPHQGCRTLSDRAAQRCNYPRFFGDDVALAVNLDRDVGRRVSLVDLRVGPVIAASVRLVVELTRAAIPPTRRISQKRWKQNRGGAGLHVVQQGDKPARGDVRVVLDVPEHPRPIGGAAHRTEDVEAVVMTKPVARRAAAAGETGEQVAVAVAHRGLRARPAEELTRFQQQLRLRGGLPVVLVRLHGSEQARERVDGRNGRVAAAAKGTALAIREAKRRAAADPDRYVYVDQYSNPTNPLSHELGTAAEIWKQTGGRVTHFVAGVGTSGTIVGVSRALRPKRVRIVAVQPDDAMHGIEGWKHMPTALRPAIWDERVADLHRVMGTEEAIAMTKRLAREEGIFTGPSGGAAVAAGLAIAREDAGRIVVLIADGGDRYLSTPLWE